MAEPILHLATRDAWQAAVRAGEYRHPSLESEGFIHASTLQQTVETANIYYGGRDDLVIACIDVAKLGSDLQWEESKSRAQRFPHIYGPLNFEAVTQVVSMPLKGGNFTSLPGGIDTDLSGDYIWLRATNDDGVPHWEHPARLQSATADLVITSTALNTVVVREQSTFVSPYYTRAHYWRDRWFNAIRLEDAGHRHVGFYCNIARPVPFDGQTASYVDMQLDVFVEVMANGSLSCRLLDEDEFEAASRKYGYTKDVVARCWQAVDEVMAAVERREFPFDA